MPFTLFHLGPALAAGLPLRKYLHAPTFIVGNVILDLEPLFIIFLGLDYPLHGYLHTLLLAAAVGLLLGFVMFSLEKPLKPIYQKMKLETANPLKLKSFLLAGISGAALHVVFDAFLYSEMKPFFPLTINPLLGGLSMSKMYLLCVYLGVFGIIWYIAVFAYPLIKNKPKKEK